MKQKQLLLGTAYYPDYYPESDWARDLARIRAAGIDAVRVLEFAWCWYQPEPDRFCWDGLDRFLALCQEQKVGAYLATSTATPPPWFWARYPDARLVDVNGVPCRAHRHMTCWNHPGARAEAFRTIEVLAARYGKHPAVRGWQIDNEPNYAEDPNSFYDFNPHFLADGRIWLREKYASLDALNRAWFACFWSQAVNAWDQVWTTISPRVNPQSHLDFLRWRDASMARFVQDQAAILRRHAQGQAVGVNIPETGVKFSVQIGQDYWAQAAGMDWVGTDLYAGSAVEEHDLACFRRNCDVMRSVAEDSRPGGAEFVMSECQGGPHVRAWRCGFAAEAWEPGYLRRSTQLFRERGAEQVWYFMWRPTPAGAEMGMNGVTDLAGDETIYTSEIRALAREREALEPARRAYEARPLALVHYSRDAMLFTRCFEDLDAFGQAFDGVHRLLDQQGFRIRYINDGQLDRGAIPDAALLVLAESPLLTQSAQTHVREWVLAQPARRLHTGMNTALLDERGHLYAPKQLALWQWLGIEPGLLYDQAVAAEIDGARFDAFRALTPGPLAIVERSLQHRGRTYPARLRVGAQITVFAYRWGTAQSVETRHAIPT